MTTTFPIKRLTSYKFLSVLFFLFLLFSCEDTNKNKNNSKNRQDKHLVKQGKQVKKTDSLSNDPKSNLRNFEKGKIENTLAMKNGLIIKWLAKGKGEKIKKGEVVLLEYRLALPDGRIIDGNQRIKMPFIPFMVGYNMQTKGWDLALCEMKVGDFVKVEIPADLARGEKGIPGVIPPNSANWLYLKVRARVSPEYNAGGVQVWTLMKGESSDVDQTMDKEIQYHAIVSTASNPSVMNTYAAHFPLKYAPGQKNVIPGLRKTLNNAKKGEKIFVLVDAKQAYGSRGYVNLIKPNETVFFNLTIKDVRPI